MLIMQNPDLFIYATKHLHCSANAQFRRKGKNFEFGLLIKEMFFSYFVTSECLMKLYPV